VTGSAPSAAESSTDDLDISVVVVAFRSLDDLRICIPSVLEQGVALELIVIDNGPNDGAESWLRKSYPQVRYHRAEGNGGYAGGHNLGVSLARSERVLLLNPDTELMPGALDALLASSRAHPEALINAQLRQPDGTVNACGNVMHYTGIVSCRGLGDDPSLYRGLERIELVSGAALLLSKQLYDRLGGFDERYFMYHEDTDLSLRARLQGVELLCDNSAVVTHHYRLAMSPGKLYHLERNRLLTLFKVFERRTLLRLAPALLLTELATWMFALLRGPAYLSARARSYGWLWRHRRTWLLERRTLQTRRLLGDEGLLAGTLAALPFDQLVGSAPLAKALDRLTRPLYALLRPRSERPRSERQVAG
jgi:GT2 family glycosyltransferase